MGTKQVEELKKHKKEFIIKGGRGVVDVEYVYFPGIKEGVRAEAIINALSVDTLKLYKVYNNYTKYVDFYDKEDSLILTIWSLGTFCFEIFDHFPIIHINAPKASGKTKLCTLIATTTRKGKIVNDVSGAYVFRIIEKQKPTLVIDDMEILSDKEKASNINSILRNGWYRGGIAGRCDMKTLEPHDYPVYSPKVISNIHGVSDDALQSRTIPISLIRSNNVDILNTDITPVGNEDTKTCWALNVLWVNQFHERIKEVYETLEPEGINGRDLQLWKPLLAIAKVVDETDMSLFDGNCYDKLLSYAVKKSKQLLDDDDDSFDLKVLYALKGLVKLEKYYTINDIKQSFDIIVDNKEVGYAMKRLALNRGKKRGRDGMEFLLSPEMVKDKFERYCRK